MDRTFSKVAKSALCLTLLLAVASCGIIKKSSRTGTTRFAPDKERISILSGESNLEVDPSIAQMPVTLPLPYINKSWSQNGGNKTNAVYHLMMGDNVTRAWATRIGAGDGKYERLASGPVSADGKVFAIDVKANVVAVNLSNGGQIWSTRIKKEGEKSKVGYGGGVAYADGTLYVTTGYGVVVALNANNGSELWRYDGISPIRNAPTVADGRVFAITHDNRIIVLDTATGGLLWDQIGLSEDAAILGAGTAVVEGSVVIAPLSSGELMAMRTENGLTIWSDSLSQTSRLTPLATLADIDGNPVIDRGRVYAVSHAGSMVAIDLRSGQRAWESNVASTRTPWVAGNFGFVVTVDAEIAAISMVDGRVRWATKLQKFENQSKRENLISWTAPVLAGNRLFLASTHGYLMSLSPYTGDVLSVVKLPAGVRQDPIVVDQTLVLLTEKAELLAFR